MSFTAKRQANLLLYQQETIINRKYILFQGGVNVFLIARYILSRERWISPLTTPSRYFPQSRQNEKKYLFQNLLFLIIRVCNKGNAIATNRCRHLSRLSNRAIIWKTELFLFFFLSRSRMMRNGRDFCASINPRDFYRIRRGWGGERKETKNNNKKSRWTLTRTVNDIAGS